MKKISFFGLLLIAVTILFTGASLISCGSDDDNKSNPESSGSSENSTSTKDGIIGWYCKKAYTSADFASYNATAEEYKHKTNSRDLFILFKDDYFAPHCVANPDYVDPDPDPSIVYIYSGSNPFEWINEFIHIIDESTLAHYYCNMGISKIGTSSRDLLYQLNGGTNIGMLAYYEEEYNLPTYYAYTREDNQIVITKGKEKGIFVIVDDGLLQNGGGKWKKYNPKQVH